MADLIISDYSSIPIEASLLNKPTLFYVYDEKEYEKVRGLNQYYYDIPNTYKVTTEEALIEKLSKMISNSSHYLITGINTLHKKH